MALQEIGYVGYRNAALIARHRVATGVPAIEASMASNEIFAPAAAWM
jgi:hypothetical protein